MKRLIAVLLVVVTVLTSLSMTVSAQTYFFIGSNSYSYNNNTYCNCKLTKPGKKDASVVVTLISTGGVTIKMTDSKGRHIWSENNSIARNMMNKGTRKYNLGRDHSVYRLYFKSTNGRGSGTVRVSTPKNCTIS